ncbi:MAG TPA: 7-carboxy-7-deazaguanine synthase QueE [Candidatus Dormibacteraeota bacterium]|nr:7-carboxy-7-deazaguanine synthase QueE [Candidatus Dormibacteraeota bacterium]
MRLNEIFYTLQGEGLWTGTPAVFVRTAGCNLSCRFCDTDYSYRFDAAVDEVIAQIEEVGRGCRFVVLTGGEPLLQRESETLIARLVERGYEVHVESNGTTFVRLPDPVWLTVSPKERLDPRMAARANEAKLIVDGRVPEEWLAAPWASDAVIWLQPEGNKPANVTLAVEAALAHPGRYRLSMQTHKVIGIR